jgi:hypothetical protein
VHWSSSYAHKGVRERVGANYILVAAHLIPMRGVDALSRCRAVVSSDSAFDDVRKIAASLAALEVSLERLESIEPTVHMDETESNVSAVSAHQSHDDEAVSRCGFCGEVRPLDLVTKGMSLCDDCRVNLDAIRSAYDAAATLRRIASSKREATVRYELGQK